MRRGSSLAALVGASLLVLGCEAAAATEPTLEQRFESPDKAARPRVRWWWPGDAVDQVELHREIELLEASGFGGAEIQAFTPNFVTLTPDERARVNDFAEPSFFRHVREAGEAAAARGISLDYTFGSAWPSGGGFAIPPEKALVELTMARTVVAGGTPGPIKLTMPVRTKRLGAFSALDARTRDPRAAGWGPRMDARAQVVAVVAMKGDAPDLKPSAAGGFKLYPWDDVVRPGSLDAGSRLVLTDRLRSDGTLDWTPPAGKWQVFVFKQFASDMGVAGAAGQGPQLTLDHMNPAAFAAHAARVGDPLGNRPVGIRSTFVDSLELFQDLPWSDSFLAEFRKRRGYDITPYLPLVLQPGWMQAWDEHYSPPYFEARDSALADRVRSDYRRTVSDLMFEGFLKPFVDWSHAHGLKAKFQAHGGALDIIRAYGIADIPETEDLVRGGDPLFMRMARSAADLYGRPIVSAEAMVWANRPYDVTPDELRRRADLLIAGGVNSIIMHGFNYRLQAQAWPGWHAFQPSGFSMGFSTMLSETNPIWPAVKPLAAYIARLQAVMQVGEPVVPIAYFYGETGYYVGIEDRGAGQQAAEKGFIAAGYDFDRINPDAIASARADRRQLVAASGHRYSALVLPPIDGIRAETAETIARFARAGVPVIFAGHTPVRDEGLADAARRDGRVRAAIQAALRAGAQVVPATQVPARLRSLSISADLTFAGNPTDLVFVQRIVDGRTVTFVHNRGDVGRDATLVLPTTGGVTRWNAMDGSIRPLTAIAESAGTRVPMQLEAGESALLVLDPKGAPQAVPAPRNIASMRLPAEGWSLAVDGHVQRQAFARTYPAVALGDWRGMPDLVRFAGSGIYRRSIEIDPSWIASGKRVVLDLGAVYDMARVRVNGTLAPPAIMRPFKIDLTGYVKPGRNALEIEVANTPENAMIDEKATGYKKLQSVPAGWFGPAKLDILQ
jgi:hypothetical protein